jgi:UDP-glucuronate decarboxylase
VHKADIKVIRIFNTYGPMMDPLDGRVVSNFIVQALKGEPLTIYGDGTQTRSFCYVDDLVLGISKMMDSAYSFIGPVNLGNSGEFTLLELAEKVLHFTKSTTQVSGSKIQFQPLPEDDPKKRKPDISLATRVLGWKPVIDLDTGLIKTIEYFDRLLKA